MVAANRRTSASIFPAVRAAWGRRSGPNTISAIMATTKIFSGLKSMSHLADGRLHLFCHLGWDHDGGSEGDGSNGSGQRLCGFGLRMFGLRLALGFAELMGGGTD